MAMIIYISGPMTGYPELNFPAFYEAERLLREKGYEVINPASIEQPIKGWSACMRKDIAELVKADGIAMLEGWQNSQGAKLELHIARELGLHVITLNSIDRFDYNGAWEGNADDVNLPFSTENITEKQKRVVQVIEQYVNEHQCEPSVRELAKLLDMKSTSTVQGYLLRLEESGYIKRNGKRGFRLLVRSG